MAAHGPFVCFEFYVQKLDSQFVTSTVLTQRGASARTAEAAAQQLGAKLLGIRLRGVQEVQPGLTHVTRMFVAWGDA